MNNKKLNKKQLHKRAVARRLRFWGIITIILGALVGSIVWYVGECRSQYEGETVRIYIPKNATESTIADTLNLRLGETFGKKVFKIWKWRDGNIQKAEGSYVIEPGMSVVDVSRKLMVGAQDPVKVVFNNIRTMDQLAKRVSSRMEFSQEDFAEACDSVLSAKGYDKPNYPAAFVPDTYEFYWNADPAYVVKRLTDIRDKYWTQEKLAQATAIGLTPEQVAVVASIVEEETNKSDERPKVARLYLNRLKRHMRLQADPTVKFAVGDFSLRRITGKHLSVESPYNTYLNGGLPPGPIRIVERKTLDDVLYAPMHNYIYMCAKEDFSGYHNFAETSDQHLANARRYHQALNRRNIH